MGFVRKPIILFSETKKDLIVQLLMAGWTRKNHLIIFLNRVGRLLHAQKNQDTWNFHQLLRMSSEQFAF
jgi:hypothetical protein